MKTVTMVKTKRELTKAIEEMNRAFAEGDVLELLEATNVVTLLADKLRYETEEYAQMLGVA